MKIFQSKSSFELVVGLTEAEALLYHEVFHHQMCVAIPELDDQKFVIEEINPYCEVGAPENSWHLVIKQEAAETMMPSTTFRAVEDWSQEDTTDDSYPQQ